MDPLCIPYTTNCSIRQQKGYNYGKKCTFYYKKRSVVTSGGGRGEAPRQMSCTSPNSPKDIGGKNNIGRKLQNAFKGSVEPVRG